MSAQAWQDGYWESADGLKLHYREYPGRADRPPILCIPGLTRNARDFEPVAEAFAGEWRVIVANLRGRGESDYARDSATYSPATYTQDILALIEQAGLGRVVAMGTSLGGIVTALLAAARPDLVAGAVLNDIGPVIEESGMSRIRAYVGLGRSFPTWMHAARALSEQLEEVHPDFSLSEWLRLAKRLMCIGNNGRITFDYDMRIAEPFADAEGAEPVELWALFQSLSGIPTLVLRGEHSDILSPATLARMEREIEGLEAVTVPRTGHAPTLDEPEASEAIARLLERAA